MSLKIGHELVGPGDTSVDATRFGGGLGGAGGGSPTWAVGNPVAVAMAGLQQAVAGFAETYDDVQVSNFLLRKGQELDQKYNHPETGLFNTRKGADAQGIYNELIEDADRITDEDALKDLSARQRSLVNKPLNTMFTDWGHKVGDFETKQLMDHQLNVTQNNISMAVDLVANSGNLDSGALGLAYKNIEAMNVAQGKMRGWDEDTIVRHTREDFGNAVVKGAVAQSVSDPTKAYGALRSYKDVIPADKYQMAVKQVVGAWNENTMQKFFDIYENEGTGKARNFLTSVSMAGRSAQRAAAEEAGGKEDAVNLADSGGMSVGLYQIHKGPKFDNIAKFGSWMAQNGKKEVADALRGKEGEALGEAWKEQVKNGNITKEDQTAFIQSSIIDPAFSGLQNTLQERVNNSSIYQDALWSTAIQHGQAGAIRLMNAAWKDSGMDNRKFFEMLYDARKGQFGNQPKNVQEAIAKRMEREKQRAVGELTTDSMGVSHFPQDELVLKPQKYTQALRMMQTRDREKGTEANRIMRENAPNAFSVFMQTGDTKDMDEVEERLVQTGDDKSWIQFKTQRAKYEEYLPYAQSNADKSFAEQNFLAMQWLDSARISGPDGNAAAIDKMKTEITRQLQKQQSEFLKDPAAYASNISRFGILKNQQDPSVPPQPEGKEGQELTEEEVLKGQAENRVRENMALQKRLSGDPNFIPMPMGAERVKKVKDRMADQNLSPMAKFDEVKYIMAEHGEFAQHALNQLSLDGGAIVAATALGQLGVKFEPATRALFGHALMPDAAVYDETRKKTDFLSDARKNEFVTFYTKANDMIGAASPHGLQTPELVNAAAKMLATGNDKLLTELSDGYSYINVEQGGFSKGFGRTPVRANAILAIPKHLGIDPEAVAYSAGRYTEQLENVLPTTNADAIAALKQTAVWVSTNDGKSIQLYKDGLPVPDKNFRPIVLDAQSVLKQYPSPKATAQPLRWDARPASVSPTVEEIEREKLELESLGGGF